jgi:hypothetical protein
MMVRDLERPPSVDPCSGGESGEPLQPAQVEPWWKLWVRRELRRGDKGRPSADALGRLTSQDG